MAAGLYFFGGGWGAALLWIFALFFAFFWAGIPAALFIGAREKIASRSWPGAAAFLLGGLATAAAWLLAMGWLGYRAWQAIP